MRPLGYFDGNIIELDEKAVGLEDRGYQFGDGIYEATMVYGGTCFALKRHMERAVYSLRELKIPIVYTFDELEEIHRALIKESQIENGVIYFQITRSTAPRNHCFPEKVMPHLAMTITPMRTPVELQESGIACITTEDLRWLRCDIKSLNLLGNVLAKQKAHEANCQEAILVRKDANLVTEGASSNAYLVKDGVVWTHPLNRLILKGVTRSILLEEIAPKLKIAVLEKAFTPEFAAGADEIFVTNTSFQVMPVTKLNAKPVGDGKPGEITRKLQAAFKEFVAKECTRGA